MSEAIALHYCKKCNKETQHMFSGSGKGGSCDTCNTDLPENVRLNPAKVIDYNG